MNDWFTTPEEDLREEGIGSAPEKSFLFVLLHCDRPDLGGARFDLSGLDLVTLGRGEERAAIHITSEGARRLAISLPSSAVSKAHARLIRKDGAWHFEDAGSKNGCYLHGKRIERARLADGDLLEVGYTILRFRAALPAPPSFDGDLDSALETPKAPRLLSLVPSVAASIDAAASIARTDITTLLHGETGTGKEVVAHGMHALSGRPGPFVAVNCGGLTPSLLESQLFGYAKGSFTGALRDEPGYIRSAEGGTLFLDEIADLPPTGQTALLRVLQEREVVPLGKTRPTRVDVRVIAATHKALESLCLAGQFRSDLFARLSGFQHTLTPLRDRIEDLGVLLADLLKRPEIQGAKGARLQIATARHLVAYAWPLNIRELYQTIAVALALAKGAPLEPAHLPSRQTEPSTPPAPPTHPVEPVEPDEIRARILALLEKSQGNVTEVARSMGKTRTQIHRWMQRFGLDPQDYRR